MVEIGHWGSRTPPPVRLTPALASTRVRNESGIAMVAAVTANSHRAGLYRHPSPTAAPFALKAGTARQAGIPSPAHRKQNPRCATGRVQTGNVNVAINVSRGRNKGTYDGLNQDRCLYGTSHITSADEAKQALVTGFGNANKATSHFSTGGSTASVVAVTPDGRLTAAQVGDSPIMLVLRNKTTGEVVLHDLTVDQRPDEPAERARIEAAGGCVDEHGRLVGPDRTLAVSHSFGDRDIPQISAKPSIRTVDLNGVLNKPNIAAFVLVCSDGLTDHVKPGGIAAEFKKKGTPAQIAERLKKAALAGAEAAGVEKSDNISVVLASLDPKARNTTYVGVADGHGDHGGAVANRVRTEVHRAFHRHGGPDVPRRARERGARPAAGPMVSK
jgi:serine/threonine protein phosphatase PrpC